MCLCFGGCRKALVLTGSTFDEDCGQGTEDERLNAAAEPVEIQTGKGRDADLEQLELAQEAGQPAKNDVAQACQRPVQQCGNDLWIEIIQIRPPKERGDVALLAEGVDRNFRHKPVKYSFACRST